MLNLGPGMKFADERNPLPATVAVGAGYRLPLGLTALDVKHRPNAHVSEVSVGTEYAILSSFVLRGGYASGEATSGAVAGRLSGMAAGFGLKMHGYRWTTRSRRSGVGGRAAIQSRGAVLKNRRIAFG